MVGLAALVDVSFGQGDAPAILKGLNQADKSIGATIKTPNGQVTKLSSSMALIETGNNNILENPNFEHSVYDTSWIIGSGSSSKVDVNIDNTKVFSGLNALKMTMAASTLGVFNVSPTGNQAYKDGVQGLVSVRIKTTVSGIRVCQRKGFAITTNCVSVVADGKWNLYKVPSILGEFYNGVEITSSPTPVTGDVYIDDAFVGASDITQNMSACNSPSCTTEFSALVDAAGIVSNENLDWINGNGTLSGGGNSITSLTFQTGLFSTTPNCVASAENTTGYSAIINASGSTGVSVRNFTTSVPTNTTGVFRIVCQRSGADFTTAKQLSNGNTYSSTNADTDWASCGHTAASFTGLGSVTNISTQCKRQGADLLMKGSFTVGIVTAVEARLSLPSWNGVQLTSAGSSVIPSLQLSGDMIYSSSSTVTFRHATLIEPSVSYMTFAYQGSTNAALQKILGTVMSTNSQSFSFSSRIPIEGWQGSNIIVGSFNGLESCSSTLDCTDTFSARFDAAGSLLSENVDWINGNSVLSDTSLYTITLNSGIFLTASPACTVSNISTSGTTTDTVKFNNTPNTTTIVVRTQQHSTSTYNKLAQPFQVICQKQGADYGGKSALAVASDQNLRTPGVTNSVVYSAYIGAAGTVVSEVGNLINGNCTVASTNVFTCTFTSGIFASDPVCNLTVMGVSGASRSAYIVTSPTTSGLTYLTYNTSGPTATALNVMLTCHGVSP